MFRFKRSELTFDWGLAKQTLKAGFPIALQLIIVSFGLAFIQRAVAERAVWLRDGIYHLMGLLSERPLAKKICHSKSNHQLGKERGR